MNIQTILQSHVTIKKLNCVIVPDEVHNNYLKLISGTNLEEDHTNKEGYHLKSGEQSDSLV